MDELEDCPECGGPCKCERCHGARFVWVQPSYAETRLKVKDHSSQAAAVERAGLLQTVYPCKVCNPKLFYRWARGCLASDHDPWDCPDCYEAGVVKGRKTPPEKQLSPSPSLRSLRPVPDLPQEGPEPEAD